jgi:plastocyanin
MKKSALSIGIGVLFFWLAPVSFAYEAIPFRNGGSIEGSVEFAGNVIPKDTTFTISSDVKYCGKEHRTEKYLINAKGRIKNVIVYLKDIKAGKALPDEPVAIIDSKCTFVPHVMIGFKGNKFVLKNEDALLHTGHVYSSIRGKTMFNIALPDKGSEIEKTLTKTGLMELNCDCHPWMEGFVYIFDHPYVTITDENGMFVINDVPSGVYTVEAWHESLGTKSVSEVTVQSGKTVSLKFKFTGK